MALGLTKSEIADEFYAKDTYSFDMQKQVNGKLNLILKIIKQKIFLKKSLMLKLASVVIKLGDKINFLNAKKLCYRWT